MRNRVEREATPQPPAAFTRVLANEITIFPIFTIVPNDADRSKTRFCASDGRRRIRQ